MRRLKPHAEILTVCREFEPCAEKLQLHAEKLLFQFKFQPDFRLDLNREHKFRIQFKKTA